jgi:hypothetical protein
MQGVIAGEAEPDMAGRVARHDATSRAEARPCRQALVYES